MIKKAIILITVLLATSTTVVMAQPPDSTDVDSVGVDTTPNKAEPQKKKWKRPKAFDNIYVGGGLGLQFGAYTVLDLSPMIVYQVGKVFQTGIGFTYLYNRVRLYGTNGAPFIYESNTYGGRVFVRLIPIRNIFSNGDAFFLHGEAEMLNLEDVYSNSIIRPRINVPGYLAGLGYQQAIGRRAFSTLTVLWNFNDSDKYPFANPIFRFGFLIGI